ncbi:MAG: biotin-dependent carboxyltransferase family protein [Proteobacteria bacterium]|nr:biotin-dependent carboxyltransferase family protein [Pseudomonadota bacterium]MDA1357196.1 biotin-dependent carboxyltransferase family protein [Pseudomonadota bacterium]
MIEVLKAGLETCVQDFPGRKGAFGMGFPPSGPIDHWSFRLANILVGNAPGAAALECQFIGPSLRFGAATVIAICGADMVAKLDGAPVPLWQSIAVAAGQVLVLGSAINGARAYIAIAGAIDTPPFLGSRATFVLGDCGGLNGAALQVGGEIPIGAGEGVPDRKVKNSSRPAISANGRWQIEVCAGPNDDWIDAAGQKRFLTSDWKLSPKSNRVGFRLEGPEWTFTDKATNKAPENGSDPSNTIDHGYPIGAINLCGQTPIILLHDTLTLGGFINPFTVPSAAFWKLGQSRPNEHYAFELISVEEAQARKRAINALCGEDSIVKA